LAQEVEMGLLDFDINQVLDNKAFQLGTNILGNNTGHYGQFGPALQGGLNDYQKQQLAVQKRQQELLRQQDEQLAREALAAQAQRLGNVRKQFTGNPYAQLDPTGFLKNKATLAATQAKTDSDRMFKTQLEAFKTTLGDSAKQKEQERKFNYDQYGTANAPNMTPSANALPQVPGAAPQSSGSGMSYKQRQQVNYEQKKAEGAKMAEDADLLKTMEANMPALNEMTTELKRLSEDATYTKVGQGLDLLAKETGFGSTDGALARKTFEATVNNSVLPLLRVTFGAAFTVAEGESLKKTLGDLDATPDEKIAVIDAFIKNKQREIQSKQRKVKGYEALPESGDKLKAGTIYTTPKGPLQWTGFRFEEIQ